MISYKFISRPNKHNDSQNCVHEETKRTIISGNACHYSVRNFLSFHLQDKSVKRKIPILQNYHYNFILCEFSNLHPCK